MRNAPPWWRFCARRGTNRFFEPTFDGCMHGAARDQPLHYISDERTRVWKRTISVAPRNLQNNSKLQIKALGKRSIKCNSCEAALLISSQCVPSDHEALIHFGRRPTGGNTGYLLELETLHARYGVWPIRRAHHTGISEGIGDPVAGVVCVQVSRDVSTLENVRFMACTAR